MPPHRSCSEFTHWAGSLLPQPRIYATSMELQQSNGTIISNQDFLNTKHHYKVHFIISWITKTYQDNPFRILNSNYLQVLVCKIIPLVKLAKDQFFRCCVFCSYYVWMWQCVHVRGYAFACVHFVESMQIIYSSKNSLKIPQLKNIGNIIPTMLSHWKKKLNLMHARKAAD